MSNEAGSNNLDAQAPPDTPIEETAEATVYEEGVELERTVGLIGGLAIGIGTMIGAGIFVFPGLAAGEAGPAAAGSFAIGAVVALLVALPTSELATAMPRSGGGYYFISRGLGAHVGAVVGLSLWLGLVFASAFYLVGFGNYALAILTEMGLPNVLSVTPLALVIGLGLTVLSVGGTENTANSRTLLSASSWRSLSCSSVMALSTLSASWAASESPRSSCRSVCTRS